MDIDLFISYSHKDKRWLEVINKYLRISGIRNWDDTQIKPGTRWLEKIRQMLHTTKVALFLLSSDFLDSEFIKSEELPVILERAKTDDVTVLWLVVRPCPKTHPLSEYQGLNNPEEPLTDLANDPQRADIAPELEKALLLICKKIKESIEEWDEEHHLLGEVYDDESSIPFVQDQNNGTTQNIHILTSVKGGVGKTLLGLGITCNYFYKQPGKRLLGIDINTMNPDLFRILSSFYHNTNRPKTLQDATSWQFAEISSKVMVARPQDPYLLPNGAIGFWENLSEILLLDEYKQPVFDFVIDTNLHIANIGNRNCREKINNIINASDRTIYLWIFWTWAAFQDTSAINKALTILKEFEPNISAVHVLNPSALIPPQIDTSTKVEITDALDSIMNAGRTLFKILSPEAKENTEAALQLLEEAVAPDQRPRLKLYSIPGLVDLAEVDSVPPITFVDFEERIARFFETLPPNASAEDTFIPLFDIIVNGYELDEDKGRVEWVQGLGGCPCNILPISTQNPDLIGYTDYFARRTPANMRSVKKKIGNIHTDIDVFLNHLVPARFK